MPIRRSQVEYATAGWVDATRRGTWMIDQAHWDGLPDVDGEVVMVGERDRFRVATTGSR